MTQILENVVMGYKSWLEQEGNYIGWYNVFCLLGISRHQTLLADIGVPRPVADDATGVVEAARLFWKLNWQPLNAGSTGQIKTMLDSALFTAGIVEEVFLLLEKTYSSEQAQALYHWSVRLFVNYRRNDLWVWRGLFIKMLDDDWTTEIIALPAIEERMNEIEDLLWEDIREAEVAFEAKVENVGKVELSPFEKRMIQLEKVTADDAEQVDLSISLVQAFKRNQAYNIWRKLRSILSEEEMSGFMSLVKVVADRTSLPKEALIPPFVSD